MKKTVLKLDLHDDKDKRKAIKSVAALPGIDSIAVEMKDQKMTVSGAADPIDIVKKLRKSRKVVEIVTVGAPQKEGGGGGGGGGGEKKDNPKVDPIAELTKAYQDYYQNYHRYIPNHYYYARSIDENPPNTCIII